MFSHPVVYSSSWPHGLQHSRLSCPSSSPGACSSSCLLLSGAIQPSHPLAPSSPSSLSFPASESFQWVGCSLLGDQNIGASPLASVLPMSIQGWFTLRLTGLISFLSKRLSRVFSSNTVWRHQFFGTLPSLQSRSHNHTWTGKTIALMIRTFFSKVMSLLFFFFFF